MRSLASFIILAVASASPMYRRFKPQDHAATQTGMILYDTSTTACSQVKVRGLHGSPERVSGSLRAQRAHASHETTAPMRVLLLIERLREGCGHLYAVFGQLTPGVTTSSNTNLVCGNAILLTGLSYGIDVLKCKMCPAESQLGLRKRTILSICVRVKVSRGKQSKGTAYGMCSSSHHHRPRAIGPLSG